MIFEYVLHQTRKTRIGAGNLDYIPPSASKALRAQAEAERFRHIGDYPFLELLPSEESIASSTFLIPCRRTSPTALLPTCSTALDDTSQANPAALAAVLAASPTPSFRLTALAVAAAPSIAPRGPPNRKPTAAPSPAAGGLPSRRRLLDSCPLLTPNQFSTRFRTVLDGRDGSFGSTSVITNRPIVGRLGGKGELG